MDLQENKLQDDDQTEPLQSTIPETVFPYAKAVLRKK